MSDANDSSKYDEEDHKVIEELKSQDIRGLTYRGKAAIAELGEMDQGAVIFLILSLNSRIAQLESSLLSRLCGVTAH